MTDLMRESLSSIVSKLDNKNKKYSHAGLLIQRGLSKWESEEEKKRLRDKREKTSKEGLIDNIISIKPSELYLLAFNRWFNLTYNNSNDSNTQSSDSIHQDDETKPTFATLSARIDGRLFTGLALGGTLETGAMTHHTYGIPMIAGSSIKGAVRNYAEHLFAKRLPDGKMDYRVEIDENNKEHYYLQFEEDKQILLGILFGKEDDEDEEDEPNNTKLESGAGYLIWHDAWWIPKVTSNMELSSDNQPFVGEVVTVHHPQYYQGTLPDALDIESPLPNQQIAIQGDFYFCIEGSEKWAEFAKKLLDNMLKEQGLGAKGSNGYGYFTDSKALQFFVDYKKTQDEIAQKRKEELAKKAEFDKATQNASEIEKQLLQAIMDNDWENNFSIVAKESFTKNIHDWLDILEVHHDEKNAIEKLISIANLHYPSQMKRPDKAKPNQQIWIKRLLALEKVG